MKKKKQSGRRPKLMRVTTHDISLDGLLRGQLRYMSEHGFDVVGVAADTGVLDTVREREGVRCVALPMKRQVSLLWDLYSLVRMLWLIFREKPDIVHANTPKGSLLAMIAAWVCRVPVRIYYVTGLRFETADGLFQDVLKLMERITCSCATDVVPEGDGVARTLVREGITDKPLCKIHNGNINGVDLSYFDPEAFADVRRPTRITYIFIGRVVRDKGICELARAFDRLCRNRPGRVRLYLVGSYEALDPIDDSTMHIIKQNPAIELIGYQDDVRPWLAASSVLVLPSHREGFPNVVLEAGAMGLPVIVTDVNGADEVIEPEYNGIIVPRNNEDELFIAMDRLVGETYLRHAMAANAREVIMRKFNRSDVHRAILERYRELLDKRDV